VIRLIVCAAAALCRAVDVVQAHARACLRCMLPVKQLLLNSHHATWWAHVHRIWVCVMRCVAMPQVMSRAAMIEWIMLDGLRDPPLEGGSALR